MSIRNKKRFVLYMTAYGATLAIAYAILHDDMAQFWTVLLGAAGFLLDRWENENQGE